MVGRTTSISITEEGDSWNLSARQKRPESGKRKTQVIPGINQWERRLSSRLTFTNGPDPEHKRRQALHLDKTSDAYLSRTQRLLRSYDVGKTFGGSINQVIKEIHSVHKTPMEREKYVNNFIRMLFGLTTGEFFYNLADHLNITNAEKETFRSSRIVQASGTYMHDPTKPYQHILAEAAGLDLHTHHVFINHIANQLRPINRHSEFAKLHPNSYTKGRAMVIGFLETIDKRFLKVQVEAALGKELTPGHNLIGNGTPSIKYTSK